MTSIVTPGEGAKMGGRPMTGVSGPSGCVRSITVSRPAARSAANVDSVVGMNVAYSTAVSRSSLLLAGALAVTTAAALAQRPDRASSPTWGYGGGPAQTRYSPLTQINRGNVKELQVAWTYDTGEPGALQTQPVVAGGVLY